MTSLPPKRCGFSSATTSSTRPSSRSTSSSATVVVPTSSATPYMPAARSQIGSLPWTTTPPTTWTTGSIGAVRSPASGTTMRSRRSRIANSTVASGSTTVAWHASRKGSRRKDSASVGGDRCSEPSFTSTTHSRQRPVRRHDVGTRSACLPASSNSVRVAPLCDRLPGGGLAGIPGTAVVELVVAAAVLQLRSGPRACVGYGSRTGLCIGRSGSCRGSGAR